MKLKFYLPMILLVVIGLTVCTPMYIEDEPSYEDDQGAEPGVILYKHANFRGSSLFVEVNRNIKDLQREGWNDEISSIELVGNVRVQVFEHKNFQGASVTISSDNIDLEEFTRGIDGNWNDKISSIKVSPNSRRLRKYSYPKALSSPAACVFYNSSDRRGSFFEGKTGSHRSLARQWNDEISSVWIQKGYQLTLYEHDKFKGKHLTLRGEHGGSVYNLSDYGFNDMVSSYILKRIR